MIARPPLRKSIRALGVLVLLSPLLLTAPFTRAKVYESALFLGSPGLRAWGINGLKGLKKPGIEGLALVIADPEEHDHRRRNLIRFLGELGPEAAPAIPALVAVLEGDDPYLRSRAGHALGRIGALTVPALRRSLENAKRRWPAAWALGKVGSPAMAALPDLLEALKDPSPRLRKETVFALAKIAPASPEVRKALLPCRDSAFPAVSKAAKLVLLRGLR